MKKQKLFLITDINGILNTYPVERDAAKKLLFYSSKGVNVRICPDRLKVFKKLSKDYDLKIVINPRMYSRLTILDYRDMFKTFGVNPEIIDIVDLTLFKSEEEMAQVFRAQEYITYHTRKCDNVSLALFYGDVDLEKKLKYMKSHLPELAERTKIIDPLNSLKTESYL